MEEGWRAFALSLLSPNYCTVEMAFFNLDRGWIGRNNLVLTDADFEDMFRLKSDITYKELAEIYGSEESAIFRRMKKFKKERDVI